MWENFVSVEEFTFEAITKCYGKAPGQSKKIITKDLSNLKDILSSCTGNSYANKMKV